MLANQGPVRNQRLIAVGLGEEPGLALEQRLVGGCLLVGYVTLAKLLSDIDLVLMARLE